MRRSKLEFELKFSGVVSKQKSEMEETTKATPPRKGPTRTR